MKDKIYTISSAHLDTSWLWTQKETIETYLPRTLKYNFDFFEKYPKYKFNFEGSYRYELIEEYLPDEFKKLAQYIKDGKWNVTGSAFENGDTNIPSPEALIRNILYGNSYFYDRFKKKSNDIFLPDCFGFGRALPQVMTHSGLIGFTTQKLSWGSSIEPPFEFGKWKAPDGSFVYTSLKPGNYSTVLKEVRCKWAQDKIDENIKTANIPYTMTFYGTGDRGGGPKDEAIETVFKEVAQNNESNVEVLSSSVTEFFEDLKKKDLKDGKLQEFDKEFLMSTHGAGSYTSRTASKRLNKKCENLLDISEKANSLSSILGLKEYPKDQLDFAWKRVLEHHFHDDITGTSFMECYKKNWNDYFLALNNAKEEYTSSIASIERNFNTSNLKNPILVFNPNQDETKSSVTVDINLPFNNVKVVDLLNNEYEATYKDNKLVFNATVKGSTLKVFDCIEGECNIDSSLFISNNVLENNKYRVELDNEYNISSIFDKVEKMELLSSPIKYNLIHDYDSIDWPAWEIKYTDISRKPYGYFKGGKARITQDNPLKVSLEIIKEFNKSTLKEIITLEKESNRVDVYNEFLWHEDSTDLKISFPLTVSNDHGTYDIGISKYNRGNNTEKLYEVPCQKFAKIEDSKYGITILTDSRQGFDKPSDNEIRLTAVHTPFSNYRYECSQHLLDFGLNIFSYSITSSPISSDNSIAEAEKFTKPLNAFKINIHEGSINNDLTLFDLSNNNARVMCFKRSMYEDNKYVLRVVDYYGTSLNDIKATFIKDIKSLYLVRGDEEILEKLKFTDNSFTFNLKKNEIKSFMIEFDKNVFNNHYEFASLPFDKCGITENSNRLSSTLKNKISIPKELIKDQIVYSKSVKYKFNFNGHNALEFNNQEIKLNRNYKYAYLLVLNQGKDGEILLNNKKVFIENSFERLGQWDLYGLKEYGYTKKIPQAIAFTHYHKNNKDQILEDLYLYSIKIEIDSDTLILNKNRNIALFALTYSNDDNDIVCESKLIDTLDRRPFDYKLTKEELKYTKEPFKERIRDIFVDRRKTKYVNWYGGHCAQSPSDFYQIEVEKKNRERRKNLKIED